MTRKRRIIRGLERYLNNTEPILSHTSPILDDTSQKSIESSNEIEDDEYNTSNQEIFDPRSTISDDDISDIHDDVELQERDSDEGEDLFGDNMDADYREKPEQDIYSSSQIDDADYEPLDPEIRQRVDAQLNIRDRQAMLQQGRIPDIFLSDPDEIELKLDSRRARRELGNDTLGSDNRFPSSESNEEGQEAMMTMMIDSTVENNTESEPTGYSLRDFIMIESFRRRIAKDYRTFLTTYVDEYGHSVYNQKIRNLCAANLESLEVSYEHLASSNAFLAKLLANVPKETLRIFDDTTMQVILQQFPEYQNIKSEIRVRITDLPTMDHLRDLRYNHLNALVRVSGVVTRRTGVFPQLKLVKFDCQRCGAIMGPFTQDLNSEIKIGACAHCQSKGSFKVNDNHTVYRNYQKITLQESPGSVPAGRLPRHKEVVLLGDLIDIARPGEEIEVTGIYVNNFSYALNTRHGFPVFATVIEANYISRKEDQFAAFRLTEDDQNEIRRLADDPNIGKRIIQSIAPSIYGHETVKTAIALSMFGGQPKSVHGKVNIRGDINVLLLGDPGTAKSQFLKYIEKTAYRAVYTTGQGASAVGLTASVRKDPVTREWTLEGGALVLADKGICLIDEFDKMNDADRTSIHEAMEQQSISISKAGIVTSLQARCAVIAAANPIRGRYNPSITFAQNVDLSDAILSRFDMLCVIKDNVDPLVDQLLARFVVASHMKSHPTTSPHNEPFIQMNNSDKDNVSLLSQDLLCKYIMYAKTKVFPQLLSMDIEKVSRLYSDLRKESLASGGIPITVRHIESIVRMAEANARIHLRDVVRSDDIDLSIRMMLSSFISAQKFSVTKRLNKSFSRYLSNSQDHFELLLFTLQEMVRDTLKYYRYRYQHSEDFPRLEIDQQEFESRAKDLQFHDINSFYKSNIFVRNGFRLNESRKVIELDYSISDN